MNTGRGLRDMGGMAQGSVSIADIAHRMENLIRLGRIYAADYDAGKVRVSIYRDDPNEADCIRTDWLPWVTPRACFNRVWQAPEVNEQVVVISPSGDVRNGVVLPSVNYKRFIHEANHPDYYREVYTLPDEDEKVVGILEYNRKTGVRRWWIEERGMFRHEIGDDSSIIQTKDHIQLRIKTTQLVIKEDSIKLHIKGRTVELHMTPTTIMAHVNDKCILRMTATALEGAVGPSANNHTGIFKILSELVEASVGYNGVLSVRRNTIQAKLEQEQVRIGLFAGQIKAMVVNTWLRMTTALAEMRVPGSAVSVEPSKVTVESPQFVGVQGSATPGEYDGGDLADEYDRPRRLKPHKTVPPPQPAEGKAPYRPNY